LTALHFATIRDRLDVACWLIARGADHELKDGVHDSTPLEWAERSGARRVRDYLQER
jgi:hypothetical protein